MRLPKLIGVLCAVAVVGAGCGSPAGDAGAGGSEPPIASTPGTPGAPGEPRCLPPPTPVEGPDDADSDDPVASNPCDDGGPDIGEPAFVAPQPGMTGVRPVMWEKAVADTMGTTVTVYYWSGVEPCNVLDHVDVEYRPDAVEITLFEGSDPSDPHTACIEIAVYKAVRIALDEPAGDRDLVDGSKGTD